MKKIFIFLSVLMISSSLIAMRCTLQKSKALIKRSISNYEKNTPDFQFDPNQVLIDGENKIKPMFCNHKHVIAYPKECETVSYSDVKVAVVEYADLDCQRIERKNRNILSFTKESKERQARFPNQFEDDHSSQVCNIIADMAPRVQLDFWACNQSDRPVKPIGEEMLSAIEYNPHFINISQSLNELISSNDHLFRERKPISTKTIDAFLEAKKKGIGIIVSAGNENMDILRRYPNMPELLEKMSGHLLICCGTAYNWMRGTSYKNLELVEAKALFSNYFYDPQWMKYGISAPAENIQCSLYRRDPISGTSFSVPMIIAAAAILKSKFPTLNTVEIFDILKKSSRKDPLFEGDARQFHYIPGVLHVTAALQLAKEKIEKENRS